MSGWVVVAIWFVAILFSTCLMASRSYDRQLKDISKRRPNPTKDEFVEMMAPDVSREASLFLWDTALVYLRPHASPHPDDDLIQELPIDDEDVTMDWPRDWAERKGFHESNFPGWPDDLPVTFRNLGRWLDRGPV